MAFEQPPLELRFRPRGAGRFAEAAFLGVWLTGWAFGETIAIALLLRGARSLLGGELPAGVLAVLASSATLPAGLLLLF